MTECKADVSRTLSLGSLTPDRYCSSDSTKHLELIVCTDTVSLWSLSITYRTHECTVMTQVIAVPQACRGVVDGRQGAPEESMTSNDDTIAVIHTSGR